MKINYFLFFISAGQILLILTLFTGCQLQEKKKDSDEIKAIKPFSQNPFYWEYNGEPLLLLGGSVDDNLFQIDSLEDHLQLLHSVGGNYVRCTMSSRDQANKKPYVKINGLYDLDKPNPAYWNRFENLLDIARKLEIIVQIEIWDPYDYYWGNYGWAENPFNPKLNMNYNPETSGLPDSIDYPPQLRINPFFKTIPAVTNNETVLAYQQKFVNKILTVSLNYPNVLYCIGNENTIGSEWPEYWSDYIRGKAGSYGRTIYVTEMWDEWDPTDGQVAGAVSAYPEMNEWFAKNYNVELFAKAKVSNTIKDTISYQYVEVSNNNAQRGEVHYLTASFVRKTIENSGIPRPINNVKIYGTDEREESEWQGNQKNAEECFWRNIFAGHASSRFHRPPYGIGLSEAAQYHIRSMRMLTDSMDFFVHKPSNHQLADRENNEAFCLAIEDREYVIYFPSKGEVILNAPEGRYELKLLHIKTSDWKDAEIIQLPGSIKTPDTDQWAVLLKRCIHKIREGITQ